MTLGRGRWVGGDLGNEVGFSSYAPLLAIYSQAEKISGRKVICNREMTGLREAALDLERTSFI